MGMFIGAGIDLYSSGAPVSAAPCRWPTAAPPWALSRPHLHMISMVLNEFGFYPLWVTKEEFQEHILCRGCGEGEVPPANTGGSQFFINVADNPDLDWWDKSALRRSFFFAHLCFLCDCVRLEFLSVFLVIVQTTQ